MNTWFGFLNSDDRRRAPRTDQPGLVVFYWDGGTPDPRKVTCVSCTGMRIDTISRWLNGTIITMALQRSHVTPKSASDGDYIIVMCKVVWTDGTHAGLQFVPRLAVGRETHLRRGAPACEREIRAFLRASVSA